MHVRFKREFPWLKSIVFTIAFPEKIYCTFILLLFDNWIHHLLLILNL